MVLALPALRAAVLTPQPGPLVFQDSFTDPNATALASHAPERGGAWTSHAGTWTISGNAATQTAAANGLCSADAGRADIDLTCTLTHGSTGQQGVVFRGVDSSNYWLLVANGTTNWLLYEVIAGSFNIRVTFSAIPPVASTAYAIRIRTKGALVVCVANGVEVARWPTAGTGLTATRVGARFVNNTGALLDSLVVRGV